MMTNNEPTQDRRTGSPPRAPANLFRRPSSSACLVLSAVCMFGLGAASVESAVINLAVFGVAPPSRPGEGPAFAVVQQARDNWQVAIAAPFVLDVDVIWGNPVLFGADDSQLCGVGGVTAHAGGKPTAATIVLNNTPGFPWFIDATPTDHEEFDPVANEPWRGTAKPEGLAFDRVDLLTCAKHELGHALGFSPFDDNGTPGDPTDDTGFPPYNAETAADGDIDVLDFTGIALNVVGPHFDTTVNVPGTAPPIPQADLLMAPDVGIGGGRGERKVMSPYDVSAVAKLLGLPLGGPYNMTPKTVVPEPATLSLLAVGGLALIPRRRRLLS